jgi:hypothetical protein
VGKQRHADSTAVVLRVPEHARLSARAGAALRACVLALAASGADPDGTLNSDGAPAGPRDRPRPQERTGETR